MGQQLDIAEIIDRAMARAEGVPLRWGRNDCALWVAGLVKRIHGYDPAADWRGRYWSERRGRELLADRRGGLMRAVATVARKHRWRRIEVPDATSGDVGLISTAYGPACVICYRPGWWAGRIDRGVALARDTGVIAAWRIE